MPQVSRLSGAASKENENRVKGCEIFVGGISRSVTESMLEEMFSSCGEILEIRIMKDQQGNPKGFAFIRFAMKDAALKAQKEKDGHMLLGKKLGVQLSADQDSLFLGNLCKDWSLEEFDKLVRQAFRDVTSVELATSSKTGEPVDKRRQNRGFAFVQFSSHAQHVSGPKGKHVLQLFLFDPPTVKRAAARAYRVGSKPDFLLGDKCHPVVDWAEKEPEIDPDELAKIKVAFVGNLPKNVDEGHLKKLFEPFGKLEKVAISRKGHFPVGFIHFSKRTELDNAIKELDGKTVQGPERGSKFQIQVSVARPVEKDRKRAHDESQSKTTNISISEAASSKDDYNQDFIDDHKLKAPRLSYSREVTAAVDPYEKAVASLPSPLVERLLQIFRLGIANRYDIDIKLIISLEELPLSAAISVLDQFMLTCADTYDKGRELARLIAKYQVNNAELNRKPLHLHERTRDFALREAELPSLPGPDRVTTIDQVVLRSTGSGSGSSAAMYERYTPSPRRYVYSTSVQDDPFSVRSGVERVSETRLKAGIERIGETRIKAAVGRSNETGSLSYRAPGVPGYGSSMEPESYHRTVAPTTDHLTERPQIKFDPFTGEPYRFDPFTGEPIRPESAHRHSGSRY